MSFDIPQFQIEPNSPEGQLVQRIMNAENVGPAEAVRLILRKANKRGAANRLHETIDWEQYEQLVPGVALFQTLPDGVLDDMVNGSRRIRSQKLTPRA